MITVFSWSVPTIIDKFFVVNLWLAYIPYIYKSQVQLHFGFLLFFSFCITGDQSWDLALVMQVLMPPNYIPDPCNYIFNVMLYTFRLAANKPNLVSKDWLRTESSRKFNPEQGSFHFDLFGLQYIRNYVGQTLLSYSLSHSMMWVIILVISPEKDRILLCFIILKGK